MLIKPVKQGNWLIFYGWKMILSCCSFARHNPAGKWGTVESSLEAGDDVTSGTFSASCFKVQSFFQTQLRLNWMFESFLKGNRWNLWLRWQIVAEVTDRGTGLNCLQDSYCWYSYVVIVSLHEMQVLRQSMMIKIGAVNTHDCCSQVIRNE